MKRGHAAYVGDHAYQPHAVLVLLRPQPLGVGRLHAAELGLPLVEGRPADAMPAAKVLGLGPRIMLLQNPYDGEI